MKLRSIRHLILTLSILVFSSVGLIHCGGTGDTPPSEQLKAFCAFVLGVGGDPNMEYIGGSDGLLLRSTDGGDNFQRVTLPFSYGIHDLGFSPDGQYGYAVGADGSYAWSADGGNNWQSQMLLPSGNLNGLTWSPSNADVGWIVGDGGTIFRTDNKGVDWTQQSSGVNLNLYGICFNDDNNGWAVGDSGTILKTTDGGSNWDSKDSGIGLNLRACYRGDLQFGFAVGYGGSILNTADEGESWQSQTSGTTADLYDIDGKFPYPVTGTNIVVGDGVILKTTDFGNSWSTVYDEAIAGFQLFLKRIRFALSGNNVYALGRTDLGQGFDFESIPGLVPDGETPSSDGLTLESNDDGDTWVQVQLKVSF